MEKVYTFNQSVRGHLHVMRDIPCEDYSCSFSDKNGRYHIAAIADGHGADSCFRSSKGSEAACKVTLECLKEFAESVLGSSKSEEKFYREALFDKKSSEVTLRRLTDLITAKWYDEVMEDYKKNPPTEAELGDYAEMYADGSNTVHIYGTTLIAALLMPSYLLLFQQGDGRCDVFYGDGSVDQPIPWDIRCQDNATTSLCDDDVLESFRTAVINIKKKKVIACYLGCDGVEDAYRDTYENLGDTHCIMGGVHAFYKDLTCRILDSGVADFENGLKDYFEYFSEFGRFSRSGSGDDVSVAGIVDLNAIAAFSEKFRRDTKLYDVEEKLFWKEDELRGKQRKREILRKRMNEAERVWQRAKSEYDREEVNLSNLNELRKEKKTERDTVISCSREYYECFPEIVSEEVTTEDEISESKKPQLKKLLEKAKGILHINKETSNQDIEDEDNAQQYLEWLERKRVRLLDEIRSLDEKYKIFEDSRIKKRNSAASLEEKFKKAKQTFDDYESKFQAIDAERVKLNAERDRLLRENEAANKPYKRDIKTLRKDNKFGTSENIEDKNKKDITDKSESEESKNTADTECDNVSNEQETVDNPKDKDEAVSIDRTSESVSDDEKVTVPDKSNAAEDNPKDEDNNKKSDDTSDKDGGYVPLYGF